MKRDLYARHGVRHLWLIDPDSFTLEVYRREEIGWYLVSSHSGDDKVRAEPFDAVEIDLSSLWEPPEPDGEGPRGSRVRSPRVRPVAVRGT